MNTEPCTTPAELKRTEIYWDDLQVGTAWTTRARTITEPDLVGFINIAWLTEPLFTDHGGALGTVQNGRLVPGSLVYAVAEGLTLTEVNILGFALLQTELDVKGPTYLGDTLHVRSRVTELKPSRKPDRACGRFHNDVVNQKGETVLAYSALRLIRRRPA